MTLRLQSLFPLPLPRFLFLSNVGNAKSRKTRIFCPLVEQRTILLSIHCNTSPGSIWVFCFEVSWQMDESLIRMKLQSQRSIWSTMELEDSCFKYSSYVLYSNRILCLCVNGTKRIASFLPHSWLNSDLNGFLIESAEFSVNAKYHWGPGTTVRLPRLTWPQISRSQKSLTINRVYLYGFEIWSVLKIAIFGPDDEMSPGFLKHM